MWYTALEKKQNMKSFSMEDFFFLNECFKIVDFYFAAGICESFHMFVRI